jgi:hypothetical protein
MYLGGATSTVGGAAAAQPAVAAYALMLQDFSVFGGSNASTALPWEVIEGDLLLSNGSMYVAAGSLSVGDRAGYNFNVNSAGLVSCPGGCTGATGSFTSISVSGVSVESGLIAAPGGLTGATGSYKYLSASGVSTLSGLVSAPAGLTGATGSFSTLAVSGSYGAWATAPIYGTSYNGGDNLTWGAMSGSGIIHATNLTGFQVSQPGMYVVGCSLLVTGPNTYTSGFAQPFIQTSTNGALWSSGIFAGSMSWANVIQGSNSLQVSALVALTGTTLYVNMAMNNVLSPVAAVTVSSTATLSYFYMYRVG